MSFRFYPVLTFCMLAGAALLLALGFWQLERRAWKLDLIEKIEARLDASPIDFAEARARADAGEDLEYTPVSITGVFDPLKTEIVFGLYDGAPGGYSFVPLAASSDLIVYVNRGYIPQAFLNGETYHAPASKTKVVGLFRHREIPGPPASWFRTMEKTSDGIWFVRDPTRFATSAEIDAAPYYIDANASESASPWPKGGTTRLDFRNKHLEYALTWFGLAATLFGVFIVFSFKRS